MYMFFFTYDAEAWRHMFVFVFFGVFDISDLGNDDTFGFCVLMDYDAARGIY